MVCSYSIHCNSINIPAPVDFLNKNNRVLKSELGDNSNFPSSNSIKSRPLASQLFHVHIRPFSSQTPNCPLNQLKNLIFTQLVFRKKFLRILRSLDLPFHTSIP